MESLQHEQAQLEPSARRLLRAWVKGPTHTAPEVKTEIGMQLAREGNQLEHIASPFPMQLLGEAFISESTEEHEKMYNIFYELKGGQLANLSATVVARSVFAGDDFRVGNLGQPSLAISLALTGEKP